MYYSFGGRKGGPGREREGTGREREGGREAGRGEDLLPSLPVGLVVLLVIWKSVDCGVIWVGVRAEAAISPSRRGMLSERLGVSCRSCASPVLNGIVESRGRTTDRIVDLSVRGFVGCCALPRYVGWVVCFGESVLHRVDRA